jgi:hypothetical protein
MNKKLKGEYKMWYAKSMKMVDFGEEQVYCEEVSLDTTEFDELFEDAPYYVKNAKVFAHQVKPGEEKTVKTELDATQSDAKVGDWIVTNPGGEKYVVKNDIFQNAYESTSEDGVFISTGVPVKAVEIDKNIVFEAPWGSEEGVKTGGFVVERSDNGERYGIEREAFLETYEKIK